MGKKLKVFYIAGMLLISLMVLSACNGNRNPSSLDNLFNGSGVHVNNSRNTSGLNGNSAGTTDAKHVANVQENKVQTNSNPDMAANTGGRNAHTGGINVPNETVPPIPSNGSIPPGYNGSIPTGYECEYEARTIPVHQGLLDYTIASSLSNPDTKNKVTMSRRFSVVDKKLASQYLLLQDFNGYKQGDTVFSMLEYYACMFPDWLYQKLEGLYLVKYDGENVVRTSVLVFKDRATTEYVAQLLLALSSDGLQFKWVNGNYVAYTAQKSYWWTHGNSIIRIASHTVPMKANATGVTQEPSYDFSMCETLEALDSMDAAKCIHDQFWKEVPQDILYAYLAKLPSDGENISWPEPGQFASLIEEANWPNDTVEGEHQWGCDPDRNKVINDAFASMKDVFSGDKATQEAKTLSRLNDGAKVTDARTDKRWYYLGEPVSIFGKVLTLDENQGTVTAEVNKNIFPHPETDVLTMTATKCGPRETYSEKTTNLTKDDLNNLSNFRRRR